MRAGFLLIDVVSMPTCMHAFDASSGHDMSKDTSQTVGKVPQ